MQKTGLGRKTIISILLALVLALGIGLIAYPMISVNAATIKTSTLYTSAENVKYKGTKDGTELSINGYANGSVTFKNKLYMDKMAIEFAIKSNNFDKVTFTFLSVNKKDETKADKLENKVEFIRNESGATPTLDMRLLDGYLTPDEQKEVKAISSGANFENAEVKLEYENGTFKATVGGTQKTLGSIDGGIYYNEADLKISFEDVEQKENEKDDDIIAKILLKSINNQTLAETDGAITDSNAPTLAVDYGVYNVITSSDSSVTNYELYKTEFEDMTDAKLFLLGTKSNMSVPVRMYDVLQSSLAPSLKITLVKDKDGNAIAEADQKSTTVSGTNCYLKEEGVYKIVVSAAKSNESGSETVDRVIYVKTIPDNAKPILGDWYGTEDYYASAGVSYSVKRPEVSDANKIDTKYNVTYTLWYKAPSSSDWTKATGLKFTPTAEGLYVVKIQATDKCGNISEVSVGEQKINFRDTDAPKITITNFPKQVYKDSEMTVPTGSVSDTVDTSPTKEIKVYFLGADGTATPSEDNLIELKNNKFTPEEIGIYKVIYTAKDAAGFKTVEERTFKVVEDTRPVINPAFANFWNGWTIALICIAGVSLIGIIALIFVKPKKKESK